MVAGWWSTVAGLVALGQVGGAEPVAVPLPLGGEVIGIVAEEPAAGGIVRVQVNLNDQEGQKTWHQFQQDVEQCRRLLRGLFEGDSLFARSLVTTLDAAQLAGIETETRERRAG